MRRIAGRDRHVDALSIESLFPLAEGNAWSYDVADLSESGAIEGGALHLVRVESVEGERVELLMNGTTVTYERRPEGLFDVVNDTWVLKQPLAEGTTWPARSGRTAAIMSTAESVVTPAGEFSGCLHIREVSSDQSAQIDNYFCPEIGLTVARSAMRAGLSGQEVVIEAKLRTLPLLN